MDLNLIKETAKTVMAEKRSHAWKEKGNKYAHGERVAVLASTLRMHIFPERNEYDDILFSAAWFHDIKNGKSDHAAKGAAETRILIADYCTGDELNQICHIMSVHDDRDELSDAKNGRRGIHTDIVMLHQDADLLDHFGTYDVLSCFAYMLAYGQSVSEAAEFLLNERPKEDEKYLYMLNYEYSREIYREKSEFLSSFARRFAVESSGGIYNGSNDERITSI